MSVIGLFAHPSTRRMPLALVMAAFFCGILFVAPVPAQAADGQVILEGSFDTRDLRWEADDQGVPYPVLGNTRTLAQPGLPQLPAREIVLLVPLEAEVANLWIEPLETHREPAKNALAIAPALFPDSGGMVTTTSMARRDGSFPATWGEFTGSHVWRGYRLATISVYPVREIQTASGVELDFLDRFAVRMESGASADLADMAIRERLVDGEANENAQILAQFVDNPETILSYRRDHGQAVGTKAAGFAPTKTPSLQGSAVTYLIITNEVMAPTFQILADFKTAQGLPSVVATREFIEANYRNGADIQDTIRMFIRDAYQKWGVEYVLMGGDSDILPPRYIDNTFYPTNGYTSIPVDLYFACLDGNWNDDGDSNFGEPASLQGGPGDLVDFAEEVYHRSRGRQQSDHGLGFCEQDHYLRNGRSYGRLGQPRPLRRRSSLSRELARKQLHHPGRRPVCRPAGQRLPHSLHRHGIHEDVPDRHWVSHGCAADQGGLDRHPEQRPIRDLEPDRARILFRHVGGGQ